MPIATAFGVCLLAIPALSQDPRAIDGDTIAFDGETVRLWGIDAPEIGQYCRAFNEPVDAGALAADILGDLAQTLSHCEPIGMDPDAAVIARCYLGTGEDLGAMMVAAGFAWDWPHQSGGAYTQDWSRAVAEGRGLTTIDCMPPWEWRQSQQAKSATRP